MLYAHAIQICSLLNIQMEYISLERNLEGTCGDPGPLFGDQDSSLLDHLDYQGGGIPQQESPTLDGLFVDRADAMPHLLFHMLYLIQQAA